MRKSFYGSLDSKLFLIHTHTSGRTQIESGSRTVLGIGPGKRVIPVYDESGD
jgi:peptidyl-tRNA hydrolase